MIYWILLILIAALAYGLGSMSSVVIASNYIFHANLRRLGKGNVALSNFRRIYGVKGIVILLLVEVLRDVLVILIGGWLLGIKDHAMVGRLFAAFCLIMGRLWPLFYDLRGEHGLIALIVAGFFIDVSVGIVIIIAAGAVLWFTRYTALATVAGAVLMSVVTILTAEGQLVIPLALCITGIIVVRHIPALRRIMDGKEVKLSLQEDLSYKFDQRF